MRSTEILLTIKLKQQLFADPKRIRLLKEIEKCGSINQAAKNAKVSYKSAWDHLEAMNKISPKPLLERNIGGKNGGGTALTVYAQRLLQLYDLLEQTQEKAFSILKDEKVPLNSLLSATARFSLQSSARNQFFGIVQALRFEDVHCFVDIELEGFSEPLTVSITEKSAVRLKLELNKEVMLMFKAPWVKIRAKQARNMPNQFRATVKSIIDKGEAGEAILVLEDLKIEFCATLTKTQHIELEQQVWISVDPEQIILATLY
ncbi:LysR family transcriptional regulator [Aggregatibacter actinomycetemcomitans]|uniref:TOBE domain-containing protein n=1 Tax=Aggregatibacter actinomycetemcomitans TaxID=714 RepID=UPI0011D92E88|nr:TOBE domain-containing protein [Aggregatibacter actinomycetemcomitans]TYA47347.1 LysR family transcriptional regulator [Aggregatibacter actinomycetemcomitans]